MEIPEAVHDYVDAFARADVDGCASASAPDGTYSDPGTAGPLSGQAIRDHFAAFFGGFPDAACETVSLDPVTKNLSVWRWILRGTKHRLLPGDPGNRQVTDPAWLRIHRSPRRQAAPGRRVFRPAHHTGPARAGPEPGSSGCQLAVIWPTSQRAARTPRQAGSRQCHLSRLPDWQVLGWPPPRHERPRLLGASLACRASAFAAQRMPLIQARGSPRTDHPLCRATATQAPRSSSEHIGGSVRVAMPGTDHGE